MTENNVLKTYLHDLIRALLVYEPEIVRDVIIRLHPEWKLFHESKIVKAVRPEVGSVKSGFLDCLWCLESVNKVGMKVGFAVFFEVKTGKYSEKWYEQLIRRLKALYDIKEMCNSFIKPKPSSIFPYIIYVVPRKDVERLYNQFEKIPNHVMYRKNVRIIPLEPFIPIVVERIENLIIFLKKDINM